MLVRACLFGKMIVDVFNRGIVVESMVRLGLTATSKWKVGVVGRHEKTERLILNF